MTVSEESKRNSSFLYKALRLDGIFALVSGVMASVGYKIIASLLDLDPPVALLVVGLMVLGYGLALLIFTRRKNDNHLIGLGAIIINTLWVMVSYLGLLLDWWDINTAGKWTIALIAEVVFIFAILEIVGLRRIARRANYSLQVVEED